jgi:hypothetical protein
MFGTALIDKTTSFRGELVRVIMGTTGLSKSPQESELLSKVEKIAERSPEFTFEEVQALKKMADAWRGLEAFGRVAGIVKKILTFLGWGIGIYIAIRTGAVDFIKSVVH